MDIGVANQTTSTGTVMQLSSGLMSGQLSLAFTGLMLLTFMTTHLFQFRFADTEQYWLITLTFFRPVVSARTMSTSAGTVEGLFKCVHQRYCLVRFSRGCCRRLCCSRSRPLISCCLTNSSEWEPLRIVGSTPFRGLVRGFFPAPHHHDPNKMLPNFPFWVVVRCSTCPPCTSRFWRSCFEELQADASQPVFFRIMAWWLTLRHI